jgi:hypothetical protein
VVHCLHVLLQVGFKGNGKDVVEIVLALLRVQVLRVALVILMRNAMKLIGYFCQGLALKKEVLLTVEVDPHKIHLHRIPHIVLLALLTVEVLLLVLLPYGLSADLIDLNAERVTLFGVLVAQMDALDVDHHVVQQFDQQLLNVAVLLLLLPLQVRLELLQGLFDHLLLLLHEDVEDVILKMWAGCHQHVDIADVYADEGLLLAPGQIDLDALHVTVLEFDGEVETGEQTGLQSDVGEDELAVEQSELDVLLVDAVEEFVQELRQHNLGDTFKDHSANLFKLSNPSIIRQRVSFVSAAEAEGIHLGQTRLRPLLLPQQA